MSDTLRGERVTLRPLTADDVPRLAEIAAEPEVAYWWLGLSEDELREKAGGDEDALVLVLVIEDRGEVVGLIEAGEEDDPDYRHANIDVFVSGARRGQGVGADAIRTLARHLFEDRGHHRITIDPAAGNERAIRAYERVGFKRVGIMRRYERGADGEWHDGLLLDLLPEELT
jgi:aminoglycoside 6'-N-acetyltransferase